jgi:processing peptidase subunit beta
MVFPSVLPKNMTSKLAMDQGEQHAAAVLKIVNASYKDSGLFGVYFEAPDNRCEDAIWYALWNLVRMVHKTSAAELYFAQDQLKQSLLLARATTAGSAACLAKDLACYGRPVPLKELFARVDAVTVADLKAVAKKVVNDQDHALAAVGAIYELPDYNWIRRRSHWLRY